LSFRGQPKRDRMVRLPVEIDLAVERERIDRGIKSFSHTLAMIVANYFGMSPEWSDIPPDDAIDHFADDVDDPGKYSRAAGVYPPPTRPVPH
jgi:hypothetical protein